MLLGQVQRETKQKMTFQVGLFCRDGILLAGDTRVSGEDGLWTSSQSKFLSDMNMVIAKAGTSVASRVAEDFLKEQWNGSLNDGQRIAETVYKKEFGGVIDNEPISKQHPVLLIVVRPKERRVFHFCMRTRAEVVEVKDKIISGDGSNSGVFILERYYDPTMPLREAKRIAALTVWFTGKLNPYVGGLEMIEFPYDRTPHVLDEGEIKKLTKWCEMTDKNARQLLTTQRLRWLRWR